MIRTNTSLLLLALSLSLALPAAAQQQQTTPPPMTITSITPAQGPSSGGTPIMILGRGLTVPPNFACFAPCPTTVRFDNSTMIPTEEKDSRLVVTTPPHTPGTVNVTITTGDGRSMTVANGYTYVNGAEGFFEKVLIPVYSDGIIEGDKGSRWQTELWFRNHGDSILSVAPWGCDPNRACLPVFPTNRGVLPRTSFRNLSPFDVTSNPNAGRLLYVVRGGNYSMNVRLADISRHALDAGTEMPVVRERELLTTPVHLLNVPLDGVSRLMLRIYDVDQPEARFRIRVWRQDAEMVAPYIDTEVTARASETGPFRLQPAYAQHTQFIDPAALVILPLSLRIEVTPLTPGSRFWAFVSVTNNATQHVTIVTPQ